MFIKKNLFCIIFLKMAQYAAKKIKLTCLFILKNFKKNLKKFSNLNCLTP